MDNVLRRSRRHCRRLRRSEQAKERARNAYMQFPRRIRPGYFELLIMKTVSCTFQLPLYPEDVLNKDFKKMLLFGEEEYTIWENQPRGLSAEELTLLRMLTAFVC